jgi:hypothetical protein
LRWAPSTSITLVAQHDGVRLIYQIKDREGPRAP